MIKKSLVKLWLNIYFKYDNDTYFSNPKSRSKAWDKLCSIVNYLFINKDEIVPIDFESLHLNWKPFV